MKLTRRKRVRMSVGTWLILVLLAGGIIFELYHLLMPYVARNPMYHEVTTGEPVIDDWVYGGENAEGYLTFENLQTGQKTEWSPSTKMYSADGKFVIIEHADQGSLTYAEPLESAPPIWYLLMAGIVGAAVWLMIFRVKRSRKRRMRLRKASQFRAHISNVKSSSSAHGRFRPAKRQRPKFFR